MTEPVTLTAAAIATLAFTKFFESGVGKLGEKFTETALKKMDELRQKIWQKLRGNKKAETALTAIEAGSREELKRLEVYLQDAMDDDPDFAASVKALAHEINAGKLQDNSQMEQNIYGEQNTGYQTKIESMTQGGKTYNAAQITINENPENS
ncbi:MAG: hypothetical protein QNJ47_25560 [Nostocaceae cyanobacterium]|nr:hypothetical protein [Nostocaceae cyanobacterium]